MDAKKISAVAILASVTTAVGYISQSPIALGFIAGFVSNHPIIASVGALLSALGLLFHPQPHN